MNIWRRTIPIAHKYRNLERVFNNEKVNALLCKFGRHLALTGDLSIRACYPCLSVMRREPASPHVSLFCLALSLCLYSHFLNLLTFSQKTFTLSQFPFSSFSPLPLFSHFSLSHFLQNRAFSAINFVHSLHNRAFYAISIFLHDYFAFTFRIFVYLLIRNFLHYEN